MKIKTIDINAKEWFDKLNGNSYFSAEMVLNYGLPDELVLNLPFQYGYGEHYISMADKLLKEKFGFDSGTQALSYYCRERNVILRTNKQENCLKKELN